MTTWFVTRHPGAIEWAARQGLRIDRHVAHLDPASIAPGDTVIGILPVNLAARVCERGARYFNLSLELPAEARGGTAGARSRAPAWPPFGGSRLVWTLLFRRPQKRPDKSGPTSS